MSIGVNLRVTGHTSIGGRKYQEDYFSVAYQQTENDQNLEYAYFGIYDGHGGAEASLFAKEHLMNTIVSQKQFWSENDEDVLKSIREGYIQTHYSMWREQDKWPKTSSGLPSTAGTTASIAFIRRGKIYIGHVGDSGIVLGYQKDKESPHDDDSRWVASPLTEDHKPESYAEKMRIMSVGGKVVTKSGVPRVVWNRPRIGHKGPVRRSTPIDEIPFLAVARSLGDLWSYNSAVDEFIVSPVPDVSVIEIDPKKFRCLIFGTDGLWNVISPKSAVDIVRNTEMENIRIALEGGNEWKNPSKLLVNEALERWSRSNMKADNTSVVIIMLDPPGPPKRDVLKSVKHSIQHASSLSDFRGIPSGSCAPTSDMYDLYDCITRGEGIPALTSGEPSDAPSMRYLHHHHHHHHHHIQQQQPYQHHRAYHEVPQQTMHHQQHQPIHHHHHHPPAHRDSTEYYGSERTQHLVDEQHDAEQYCHPDIASTSYHDQDLAYTDTSFAESYNSLLDRSYENSDHSYTSMFHSADDGADSEEASTSTYQNRATLVEPGHTEVDEETLIEYLPESDDETVGTESMGLEQDATYSLTNLQTKSERLRAAMVAESEGSSQSHPYYHHQHHPQHRVGEDHEKAEESGGAGCYSGGNLAIIEHFHNYHHPLSHSGRLEEQQSIYSMEMAQQYHASHHQAGSGYEQSHFHHAPSSMERFDYRQHHSANNNLPAYESTCSARGGLSRQKTVHNFGYLSGYGNEPDTETQPAEDMMDEEEEEIENVQDLNERQRSGDAHHIQINEISSSYTGTSASNASPACLLSASDSEGGDEENHAASSTTTKKLVVVPALVSKPRSLRKSTAAATRVITIFYETRSSRRKPRDASRQASLLGVTSINRIATKRRKTATVVQATIAGSNRGSSGSASSSANATVTPIPSMVLERRVLRSNVMNTSTTAKATASTTTTTTTTTGTRSVVGQTLLHPVVNNYSVSSTTAEAKPTTVAVCTTRRTKQDDPCTAVSQKKRNATVVATLVRTDSGVVKMKHKSTTTAAAAAAATVVVGSRKPATHQQRTMLLRRTTQ